MHDSATSLKRPHWFSGIACAVLLWSAAAAAQTPLRALDASTPIGYYVAEGEAGSAFEPRDRELAEWALAAWSRASNGKLEFRPVPEDDAILRIYWVPASAGQYGEMRPLIVDDRLGAEVFIRPDVTALGPDIGSRAAEDRLLRDTIVYLTCLHETGHALGLAHTAEHADVMYFFGFGGDIPAFFGRYREQLDARGDIASVSGLSPGDLAQLDSLYGSPRSR